jgi:peroxiredoxin
VELQERLEELENSGFGIAAISYNSEAVLADFAQRRGITFPLLSDDDSAIITEFGILNTVAAEGLGPNADDPAVQADVARYVSVFGPSQLIVGTPYPGTFMVNSAGEVTSRFFEEFYRERNSTSNVMLKLGVGVSPIEAVQGSTAHLNFTAYPSNSTVTVGTRFSLALEVEPGPEMHVYAPGAEEKGYRVIGFNLAPTPLARIEPVQYPESEIYYFEPLDEYVPVYQERFTLLQEIVMHADAEAEGIMAELDALTLSGTLEYQACDDAICFLPQSIPVSFTVDLEMPDRQRALR